MYSSEKGSNNNNSRFLRVKSGTITNTSKRSCKNNSNIIR